jgi:hypothetical protein
MSEATADEVGESPPKRRSPLMRVQQLALLSAMGVVSVNIWTGAPLLALLVASRIFDSGPLSMASVFVVAALLAAFAAALVMVLGVISRAYDRVTGRERTVRTHLPWLRSMRGERPREVGAGVTVSAPERVLIGSVVLAVIAFEIWFFFFSTSPFDQRTGRE